MSSREKTSHSAFFADVVKTTVFLSTAIDIVDVVVVDVVVVVVVVVVVDVVFLRRCERTACR